MGANFGIWLERIGGYSHQDWQVGRTKARGYEIVLGGFEIYSVEAATKPLAAGRVFE